MLTCITCSKQEDDGVGRGEDGRRGTPRAKESVKSLTAQIKDIALKFSGAYRQCRPCTSTGSMRRGQRSYPDLETIVEDVPYPYYHAGSSSSTPAWDYTSSGIGHMGRMESGFAGLWSGSQTPIAAAESTSEKSCEAVLEDEGGPKEWMAQVEPGVHITFVSLPSGGNNLKRIRFNRDMFDKWEAQQWWGENFDRIMELYNVQRFNQNAFNNTPMRSDDDEGESCCSRFGSAVEESPARHSSSANDMGLRMHNRVSGSTYRRPSYGHRNTSFDPTRMTTSSREDDASVSYSNSSEVDTEWIEEDEPGVYITLRQLSDGTRELRRVRFSRERFGEVHAKVWWEENRERIQSQYL